MEEELQRKVKDKEELMKIIGQGEYAKFKNHCGIIQMEPYEIEGGIPPYQKQYKTNKKAIKALEEDLRELEDLIEGKWLIQVLVANVTRQNV